MLKKKPPAPQPRQRVVQDLPPSTAVFSYHANRAATADPRDRHMDQPATTPRYKRHMPRWLRPKNILLAIIVLVVFLLLVGLDSMPKIVITGDQTARIFAQDSTKYQQAARKLFAQSYLNGNKLTVNAAVISRQLAAEFPELRAVSVTLPVFGRQPVLYVQPATPQLLLATQYGDTFVLDSAGRALLAIDESMKLPTGDNALPTVTDQSGIHITAGSIALPSSSVAFITQVAGQLRAQEIGIETLTLPQQASELDIKIAGVPYFVKFNLQGKAREQSGTFIAARNYLQGKRTTPGEYIDARVSGRAYYK